jgi:hypothetical protein
MWKLEMRGARGTPFTDLGSFASINDAARVITQTEGKPLEAIFFRVYADPLGVLFPTDKDVLSRLDYQTATRYYVLSRSAN